MKRFSLILILFIFSVSISFAQKNKYKHIPAEAVTKFNSLYPKAKDVDWFKNNRIYVAEFLDGQITTSVLFDLSGKILQIVQYIDPKELPQEALDYIAKHYKGKRIGEVSKIKDSKADISYIVEIKKVALIFDEDGKFVRISR